MRTANKLLLTMGSAMLISSGVVMADPPTSYGQYTVLNGGITPNPCPSGFTCGAPTTGKGFFQRQLTDSSGNKYFQTIITPTSTTPGTTYGTTANPLSSLDFTDENFVKQGGGTGIADSQHVYSAATTANPGDFSSTTAINSGWAKASAAQNAIDLHQNINDVTSGFGVDFTLQDASTDNSAPVVTLREDVSLYTAGNPNSGEDDKQVFVLKQLKAGSDGSTTQPVGAIPVTSISWTTGQLIQAMWLAQVVTSGTTASTQAFGVQSYTNVDKLNANQPDPTMSYADLNGIGSAGAPPPAGTATGPGTWWDAAVFGTAPVF
jgi:hypothetical protein